MTILSAISAPSIEVKFVELPVFGLHAGHGAGDRAPPHGFGLDDVLAELDAGEQRSGRDPGCGEQAVALCHILDAVNHARIGDAHLAGTLALLLGIENEPALHLAADAAKCC